MRVAVGVRRNFRVRILGVDHSLHCLTKHPPQSFASNIRADKRTPAGPRQSRYPDLVTGNDLPELLLALHLAAENLFQIRWKLHCLFGLYASHRNPLLAHSAGHQ